MKLKLEKIIQKYKNNPSFQFIVNLIPKLGPAMDKAFTTISEKTKISEYFEDIHKLSNFLLSIDAKILNSIRDLEHMSPDGRITIYKDIIRANILEKNITIRDLFTKYFSDYSKQISDTIVNNVAINIQVDSNLDNILFKTREFDLVLKKPLLFWDCHCSKPDGVIPLKHVTKYAQRSKCPIHSKKYGKEITNITRNELSLITFDGIQVLWKQSPEFWPPSIDTFMMCENLIQEGLINKDIRTILDIGSGTGFLGIYFGIKNPNINKVYLADWLLTPLFYSMVSWELNNIDQKYKSIIPLIGINSNWLLDSIFPSKFDLCLCNPPYLPDLKEFPSINIYNTVGGTELLEHVITRITEIAQETYINFSDLTIFEATEAAKKNNKILKQIGNSRLVPFRVPQAYNCQGYVEKLLKEKRILKKYKSRYKYWHIIRTYRIE